MTTRRKRIVGHDRAQAAATGAPGAVALATTGTVESARRVLNMIRPAGVQAAARSLLDQLVTENQHRQSEEVPPAVKLWISTAYSPHSNPYGAVLVTAETKDEAIAKAREALKRSGSSYDGVQRYRQNLIDHLDSMTEVEDGVFVDWSPAERRR